jgi:hypothetical protein
MRGGAGLAALCLTLGFSGPDVSQAAAETHAVVIGINDYANLKRLRGAVADCHDLSEALKKAAVTDLVVLIDMEATRKNVLGAIDRLISRANKGDLAIITFAGLGSREAWGTIHPPGAKVGEQYATFLMRDALPPNADGGIDPSLSGSAAERILDAEMAVRLKRLDDMDVRTIFVADTGASYAVSRFADGADPLAPAIGLLPAPINIDADTRLLSYLTAAHYFGIPPEIEIPMQSGNLRGALSYAFARVVEGAALRDDQTGLSHGDLVKFVTASIKSSTLESGTGQHPDLRPRRNFDRVVIEFGVDLKPGPAAGRAIGESRR